MCDDMNGSLELGTFGAESSSKLRGGVTKSEPKHNQNTTKTKRKMETNTG